MSACAGRSASSLVGIVNEMATWAVGAEANGVESAAELSFVLRVACESAQFRVAVRKLALITILAETCFLEGATQLGLVAGGIGLTPLPSLHRLGLRSVQPAVEVGCLHG